MVNELNVLEGWNALGGTRLYSYIATIALILIYSLSIYLAIKKEDPEGDPWPFVGFGFLFIVISSGAMLLHNSGSERLIAEFPGLIYFGAGLSILFIILHYFIFRKETGKDPGKNYLGPGPGF